MKSFCNMSVEEKVAVLQERIDNYKPETKWEKENNRMLKALVSKRNKLEKLLMNNERLDG